MDEAVNLLVGTMTADQWIALSILLDVGYPISLADKETMIRKLAKINKKGSE